MLNPVVKEILRIVDHYQIDSIRLHYKDSYITGWETWLISPVDCCVEISSGPVAIRELKAIEIVPIETIHIGRLIPDKKVDHRAAIIAELRVLNIPFQQEDGTIIMLLSCC